MSKTIYKYPLEITDVQQIEMPLTSNILTAQMQNGVLCLWAAVETSDRLEKRTIFIFGTGNPMLGGVTSRDYIATVQDGKFVWHIFG